MNAADLNQAHIARLESEIGILKGALNLSRERAEDAEADLAEARRDLALESHRADDAELERDNARVEAMGLAWELGQLRDVIDQRNAQLAVTRHQIAPLAAPRGLTSLATAAEHAARQSTLIESPAVAKIAAELVAVMAENERPTTKTAQAEEQSSRVTHLSPRRTALMKWKKTKITIRRWNADGFRITEAVEAECRPFRLESLADGDQEPIHFSTLDQAKLHGEALNELALVRADNARLLAELHSRAGRQPIGAEGPPVPTDDECEATFEEDGTEKMRDIPALHILA